VIEHEMLGEEAAALMEKDNLFNSKKTHGSASLAKLPDQVSRFRKKISEDENRL